MDTKNIVFFFRLQVTVNISTFDSRFRMNRSSWEFFRLIRFLYHDRSRWILRSDLLMSLLRVRHSDTLNEVFLLISWSGSPFLIRILFRDLLIQISSIFKISSKIVDDILVTTLIWTNLASKSSSYCRFIMSSKRSWELNSAQLWFLKRLILIK